MFLVVSVYFGELYFFEKKLTDVTKLKEVFYSFAIFTFFADNFAVQAVSDKW